MFDGVHLVACCSSGGLTHWSCVCRVPEGLSISLWGGKDPVSVSMFNCNYSQTRTPITRACVHAVMHSLFHCVHIHKCRLLMCDTVDIRVYIYIITAQEVPGCWTRREAPWPSGHLHPGAIRTHPESEGTVLLRTKAEGTHCLHGHTSFVAV